jgi:Proteasome subunit
MTICVAVICDSLNSIVTASDTLLSTDRFSADNLAVKVEAISQNWMAFFAADDMSSCWPILREARARFVDQENTIEQIKTSFKEAYRSELQKRITDEVLGRYALDLESFKQNGLKQLGRQVFNDLCLQIDRINFDCQFLVCGFDSDQKPHIFTVENPGVAIEYSTPGFWAIGSGASSALSTLFFHRVITGIRLEKAIYHVCEAKFMAESALGVGVTTCVVIFHKPDEVELLDEDLVDEIKKTWTREGQARVPSGIEAAIKSKIVGKKS